MTIPTPTQIEAAAKAVEFTKAIFEEYWPGCHDIDGAMVHELGEKHGVLVKTKYDPEIHGEAEYDQEPGDDWFVLDPALTAAAQVDDDPTIAIRERYLGAAALERDATIERCAQVADDHASQEGWEIAAAIRKLKEQA